MRLNPYEVSIIRDAVIRGQLERIDPIVRDCGQDVVLAEVSKLRISPIFAFYERLGSHEVPVLEQESLL